MTDKTGVRPNFKLFLVGGSLFVLGLAGLMATPLVPGAANNDALVSVLLLVMAAGGVVLVIACLKRIIKMFMGH